VEWAVSLSLAGLGESLKISNAHQTLKLLALSIVVRDDDNPLCGLGRELRFIAGNNILEELELDVVVDAIFLLPANSESEDWSAFDSVLTESGAFPMLHRVSVEFGWNSHGLEVDGADDEDGIWESLKEDRFPRLAESKAVEFNFSGEIFS
jgi:hypothetical protein